MRLSALAFVLPAVLSTWLVSAAAGEPAIVARDECLSELCGSDFSYGLSTRQASSPVARRLTLTNAERLRRGLPLAPPTRRRTAKRADTSAVPTPTLRGRVKVFNTETGALLGYLSKNSFSQAQLRYQPNEADAMIVTFDMSSTATTASTLNLAQENSDITAFPLVGAIQGRDDTTSDISVGSFNYGYLGGTNASPAGSPPVSGLNSNSYSAATGTSRTFESAVWSYDSASKAMTIQWINTDGSSPATFLFTQGTALYFGGDQAQFAARYPSPVTTINLSFDEILSG